MAIPFSYNWRNLIARKTTTLMTALGIGLTVAVLLATAALVEGLNSSLQSTAHPLNVLMMRKGSTAELNSNRTQEDLNITKTKRGVAAASLELVTIVMLENEQNPAGFNITIRGLTEEGFKIRENLKIVEGRMFTAGRRELVVGRGIADRYPMARVGQKLNFGRGDWDVVGVMDAGRSAANSEIFCDLNQLAADQNRATALSSILIRTTDEVAMQALINEIGSDNQLNADAQTEKSYYDSQTSSAAPLQFIGILVAIIMAIGSCFAAMNTMYAAVARRSAEIGTLRVLGFSKIGILFSFFVESMVLSLLGGLLGCLLALPLNNITTSIGSFVTFSELSFQFAITPKIMSMGIAFALAMGAAGGLLPAWTAARKEILTALRQE